ncbi:MAG: ABC transporter permease subunit [Anaerolineaceae bacterium]
MKFFLHEFKLNFKSLMVWTVVIGLLILVAVTKFSAFIGNEASLAIMDGIPAQVLDAMQMRSFNLTTLEGFFGVMFIYFALMGAMAATMWGSDAISREERDRSAEFSLVLPVSRSRVVTTKLLAALVNCVLFVLFTWVISIYAVRIYSPAAGFYQFLRLEMLAMYLIELIFLAIGVLLACAVKNFRVVGSIAIGIILSAYFLSIVTNITTKLNWFKALNPFSWFDAVEFFNKGALKPLSLILTAILVVACLLAAYFAYEKRDLVI